MEAANKYSMLFPRGFQCECIPAATGVSCLLIYALLASFPVFSHYSTSLLVFSRVTSKVNLLLPKSLSQGHFWEDPKMTGVVGIGQEFA